MWSLTPILTCSSHINFNGGQDVMTNPVLGTKGAEKVPIICKQCRILLPMLTRFMPSSSMAFNARVTFSSIWFGSLGFFVYLPMLFFATTSYKFINLIPSAKSFSNSFNCRSLVMRFWLTQFLKTAHCVSIQLSSSPLTDLRWLFCWTGMLSTSSRLAESARWGRPRYTRQSNIKRVVTKSFYRRAPGKWLVREKPREKPLRLWL